MMKFDVEISEMIIVHRSDWIVIHHIDRAQGINYYDHIDNYLQFFVIIIRNEPCYFLLCNFLVLT
jgi:hypothetical protein